MWQHLFCMSLRIILIIMIIIIIKVYFHFKDFESKYSDTINYNYIMHQSTGAIITTVIL